MRVLPKDLVRGKKHHNVSRNINKHCHKNAASYHLVISKCRHVAEMTNDNLVNIREKERSIYLM